MFHNTKTWIRFADQTYICLSKVNTSRSTRHSMCWCWNGTDVLCWKEPTPFLFKSYLHLQMNWKPSHHVPSHLNVQTNDSFDITAHPYGCWILSTHTHTCTTFTHPHVLCWLWTLHVKIPCCQLIFPRKRMDGREIMATV